MRRAALLVLCLALTGCNGGTVDRHALANDSDSVDSLACEGRLLADGIADGDSTTRFARVHARELEKRASNFEDALSERPTVPVIEREVRALARKAGDVAQLLGRLQQNPDEPDVARRLEPMLRKAGDCP
jgi:hypothetical protein